MKLVDPVTWTSIVEQIDSEFGSGVTKSLLGNLVPITMSKGAVRIFYAIPTDWMTGLIEHAETLDIQFIGKEFGSIEKGRFRLSLHILSELAKLTESLIIVSKQGADAFTYGKSIIKQSVVELKPSLTRGQRILVLNEESDCLGIAALSVDGSRLNKLGADRLVAKNLVDIGWFIRRLG